MGRGWAGHAGGGEARVCEEVGGQPAAEIAGVEGVGAEVRRGGYVSGDLLRGWVVGVEGGVEGVRGEGGEGVLVVRGGNGGKGQRRCILGFGLGTRGLWIWRLGC